MISEKELVQKIQTAFPDAQIKAKDLTGGGDDWQVQIRTNAFKGLNMIEQHQLVYKSLGSWVKQEIHALTLDTDTL